MFVIIMNITNLLLLLSNWFMLVIIMLLTVRAISKVQPYVKQAIVAQTMFYLYLAFGYSLISVSVFTSWVIWFVGGIWGMFVLFMTWFILVIIFIAHRKIKESTLKKAFNLE